MLLLLPTSRLLPPGQVVSACRVTHLHTCRKTSHHITRPTCHPPASDFLHHAISGEQASFATTSTSAYLPPSLVPTVSPTFCSEVALCSQPVLLTLLTYLPSREPASLPAVVRLRLAIHFRHHFKPSSQCACFVRHLLPTTSTYLPPFPPSLTVWFRGRLALCNAQLPRHSAASHHQLSHHHPLSALSQRKTALNRPPHPRSLARDSAGGVKMPPRSSLTSSFSITDSNNEVVCPLRNQDGSSCRKRCVGVSPFPVTSMHPRCKRQSALRNPALFIAIIPTLNELASINCIMLPLQLFLESNGSQLGFGLNYLTFPDSGKTLSLHAGTHPPYSCCALHLQAPSYGRELSSHDQYTPLGSPTTRKPIISLKKFVLFPAVSCPVD